jgi:S1-C subfamily serine protease
VLALVAMVAVGGGLLGAATRGDGLFSSNASNDSPVSASPFPRQVPSTPSSGNSGSASSSSGSSSSASGTTTGLVNINTTLAGGGEGAGTGMVVSSSGDILTNNHVIADAESISVEFPSDGSTHDAKVIGYDVRDDVALIKISNVSGLDTIPVGDPDSVQVNDPVVVVGNALGRGGEPSQIQGTVAALNQEITATDADGSNAETLTNMIRVQADVEPGDSGGALVAGGKVIGMTTAASVSGFRFQQETSGVGFAIRIDKAMSVADQIKKGDEADGVHVGGRALLGVSILDNSSVFGGGSGSSDNGAYVRDVQADSPADKAGIEGGDVITGIGDESISSSSDLEDVMNGYHPGDKVSVKWTDGSGDSEHATLQLVEGPPA